MSGAGLPEPEPTGACAPAGAEGVERLHGAAAGTTPAAAPWMRSVVRPGVPDFGVPLALFCVASTTYQPGLTEEGTVKVSEIRPAPAGTVVRTVPLRL